MFTNYAFYINTFSISDQMYESADCKTERWTDGLEKNDNMAVLRPMNNKMHLSTSFIQVSVNLKASVK